VLSSLSFNSRVNPLLSESSRFTGANPGASEPDRIFRRYAPRSQAFKKASMSWRRFASVQFGHCPSLKSICIAASVEFIDGHCFVAHSLGYWSKSRLQTVTFEAGSHLREIAIDAFAGCFSLKQICVPVSVQKMNADSFRDCRFSVIEFESRNPYFAEQGDFVMKVTDHHLVAYTGRASEVAIPDEIAVIGQSSL
jgi:hypothetical protein